MQSSSSLSLILSSKPVCCSVATSVRFLSSFYYISIAGAGVTSSASLASSSSNAAEFLAASDSAARFCSYLWAATSTSYFKLDSLSNRRFSCAITSFSFRSSSFASSSATCFLSSSSCSLYNYLLAASSSAFFCCCCLSIWSFLK